MPPSSKDLYIFLRNSCTNYGQKVESTDVKSTPEGMTSMITIGEYECYMEIVSSHPMDCYNVDLEAV